jgi:hypothetical protein
MPTNKSKPFPRGARFGFLTVIRLHHKDKRWRRFYVCRCDCGKTMVVHGAALTSGNTKSCGCIRRESVIRRYGLPPGRAAMRQLILQSYKRHGKQWGLTDDQFYEVSQRDCFYCGAKPSRVKRSANATGDFTYNGLDRVDSTKGYAMDNVVACCRACNTAKSDMTVSQFRAWVIRVAAMAEQWGRL